MDLKNLDITALKDLAAKAAGAATKAARAITADEKNLKLAAVAMGLLVLGIVLGLGLSQIGSGSGTAESGANGKRKILYWVAPMDPSYRRDSPGKSPMGMDLKPVYAGQESGSKGADQKSLQISSAVENNMGVRTAEVTRRTLSRNINTIGFIAPNDEVTSHVHVRSEGWIEKLVVKAEGEHVQKGELLFRLYSRALTNAQAEYLQALKTERTGLAKAARSRLLALGMSERQIEQVDRDRKVADLVDVYAAQDGYVVSLRVREGMFVKPNTTVYTLADLSSVWVMVEVYEDQANLVKAGQKAVMRLAFIPGKIWEGEVDYVYPTIDPESRTVRVRLKFANPRGELKPNMYSEVTIYGEARKDVLTIPREALIRTGKSERAILALGNGRFRPAQVVSGMEAGDQIEIVVGLLEGERIVSSGQFLLDSEASVDASLLRMIGASKGTEEDPAPDIDVKGVGVVNEVKAADGKLNITHDPIPAIGWPTMTMDFRFGEGVELGALKTGDPIAFTLKRDKELGDFVIWSVSKTNDAGIGKTKTGTTKPDGPAR